MLQAIFYLMALAAAMFKPIQRVPIFKVPFFFAMVNYSIVVAIYNYISKKEYILWEPTKR